MNGTIERPQVIVYIISAVTGDFYGLGSILAWNTAKGDSGDAGTWSVTLPLYNPYINGGPPNAAILAYAAVASPMDLVAIYAYRYSDNDTNPPPLGPLDATAPLAYGSLATIKALYSEALIMIGMLDSCEETPVDMSESPMPVLELAGRDLTKIFCVNDSLVPTTAGAATAFNVVVQNPITVIVKKANSGTSLLLDILDLAMSKSLASTGSSPPPATAAAISQFGFAWRQWIDTSLLDPNYQHLQGQNYPPFQFQGGTVWANIVELRNAPSSRLFVNEYGQLIFDDAYTAWTGMGNSAQAKANAGQPYGSGNDTAYATGELYAGLQASDVIRFKVSLSDEELVTYLQVRPAASLVAKLVQSTVTGDGSALGFGQGIAKPAQPGSTIINTFGYRQGDFVSYWDADKASAQGKIAVLSLLHNSLERATLIIKGTTLVSVGDRITVPVTTSRANTTNATWYIESIIHSGTIDGSYTSTLGLRFPNGGF